MTHRATVISSHEVKGGVSFVIKVNSNVDPRNNRTFNYVVLVKHEDEDIRKAAYYRLAHLMECCGVHYMNDTDELNGFSFVAKIFNGNVVPVAAIVREKPRTTFWRRFIEWWSL